MPKYSVGKGLRSKPLFFMTTDVVVKSYISYYAISETLCTHLYIIWYIISYYELNTIYILSVYSPFSDRG